MLAQVRAFDPEVVEGWPSSITLLASLLRDRGDRLPVTAVITSSEVMTTEQRRLMTEVFQGPVVDHYGQTERVAMAGGCEAGGYHEFPDYGILERLPVEGRTDRWEIVGTPLHNWGFPLFRYRTGDEVGPGPTEPCPCGRAFRQLGQINGRVEDAFTAANGQVLPLPGIVLDDLVGFRELQIAQMAPGRFEIRMVPTVGSDIPAAQERARHNVDRYFGPGQVVTFRVMDRSRVGPAASSRRRSCCPLTASRGTGHAEPQRRPGATQRPTVTAAHGRPGSGVPVSDGGVAASDTADLSLPLGPRGIESITAKVTVWPGPK